MGADVPMCSTVEESEFRNLPGGGAEKCEPVLQKEAAKVRGRRQAWVDPQRRWRSWESEPGKGTARISLAARGWGHSAYMVSFSVSTLL